MLSVFHASLLKAAKESFSLSSKRHKNEKVYLVGLYTHNEYNYVYPTILTDVGLRKVAEEYLKKQSYLEHWGGIDRAMQALRWGPCDSPYHLEFSELFEEPNEHLFNYLSSFDEQYFDDDEAMIKEEARRAHKIHDIFVDVLKQVRSAKIFSENTILNVLIGDQCFERQLINAELINPPEIVKSYRNELEIDEERLKWWRENWTSTFG